MERRTVRTKEWECSVCTLLNGYKRKTCAACLNERTESSLELFSQLSQPPPQVTTKRRRLKLSMPAAPMLSQADLLSSSQNEGKMDVNDEKNEDVLATKSTRSTKILSSSQLQRAIDEDDVEENQSASKSPSPVKRVARTINETKVSKLKAAKDDVRLSQTAINFDTIKSTPTAPAATRELSTILAQPSKPLDPSIPVGCFFFERIPTTKYPRLQRPQNNKAALKITDPVVSTANKANTSFFKTPGSPQTAADLMGRWISPPQHVKDAVTTRLSSNDEIHQNSHFNDNSCPSELPMEQLDINQNNSISTNELNQEPFTNDTTMQTTSIHHVEDPPVIIKREIPSKLALPDEAEPPSFQLLNFGLPGPSQEAEPQFNLLGNLPLLAPNQAAEPKEPLETSPNITVPKQPLALSRHSQDVEPYTNNVFVPSEIKAVQKDSVSHDWNNDGGIQHENPTNLNWNDEVIEDSDSSLPPQPPSQRKSFFDIDVTDARAATPRKTSIIDATDSPEAIVPKKRNRVTYGDESPDSKMRKVGLLDDSEEDDVVVVPRRLRRPAIAESPPSSPEAIENQGWACQQCTYVNDNHASNSCEMCGQSKKSTVPALEKDQVFDDGPWTCNVCTNLNTKDPQRCELCDTPRDKDGTSQIALMDYENDDEGMFNFYEVNSGDEAEVVDLTKTSAPKYDSDSIEEISDYEPISITSSSTSIPSNLQEFSHFIPVSCLQAKSTLKEPGIDYLNMFATRGGKNYADRRKKRLIESRKRIENAQNTPSESFGFTSAGGSKAKKSKSKVPSFQSAKAAFHSKSRKRKGKATSNADAWKSRSNKTPSLQAAAATSDAWRSRPANNGPVLLSGTTFLPKKKTQSMRVVDDGGQFDNIGFQPARRQQYATAPIEYNQGDLAMWEGKGSLNFGR